MVAYLLKLIHVIAYLVQLRLELKKTKEQNWKKKLSKVI